MKDSKEKLSGTTIALHWIIALSIISLVTVGVYMTNTNTYALYPLHKSIGMLIFVVILARVVWRISNGWPEPAANYKTWEQKLAKFTHWFLIIATVMLPISGMLMSGLGGYGLHIFGLELLASTPNLDEPGKMIPINGPMAGIAHQMHELGGKAIFAAILLHLAGALKHHFIDKDGTLRRMLGARIK